MCAAPPTHHDVESPTHYGGSGSLRRLIAPVRGAVHFGTCSFPAALWEWWFARGSGAGSSAALSCKWAASVSAGSGHKSSRLLFGGRPGVAFALSLLDALQRDRGGASHHGPPPRSVRPGWLVQAPQNARIQWLGVGGGGVWRLARRPKRGTQMWFQEREVWGRANVPEALLCRWGKRPSPLALILRSERGRFCPQPQCGGWRGPLPGPPSHGGAEAQPLVLGTPADPGVGLRSQPN